MISQPDLSRLQSQLMTSGLQNTDNPLYQVINQLIIATKQIQNAINTDVTTVTNNITTLNTITYLTVNNESVALPNSRRELSGNKITFDDSVANIRTVSLSDSGALTILGRSVNSSGIVADIAAGADANILRRAGVTLGFGSIDLAASGAVGTSRLTFPNLVQSSAASRLVGRGSASGAGNFEELTLGSGISLSGTVLSATGSITGSGTTGTISKWASSSSLTDSVIVESGGLITVAPNVALLNAANVFTAANRFSNANTYFGVAGGYIYTNNDELNFRGDLDANSVGYINNHGYNSGLTRFRDLAIQDGKGNNIAYFDGVNNRVGIGTSSPSAKLEVKTTSTNILIGNLVTSTTYGAIGLANSLTDSNYNFTSSASDTNLYINRPSGKNVHFLENNGSSQLTVIAGGGVGIGTTTRAGLESLHIVSTAADWTAVFKNYTAGGYGLAIDNSGGSGAGYTLAAYTNSGTGFFVANNANVGIGTSSPNLLGSGRALTISGASTYSLVELQRTPAISSSGNLGIIDFYNGATRVAEIGVIDDGNTDSGAIQFWTKATSGSLTEQMRINSVGEIGIGITPAAGYKLSVNGAIKASKYYDMDNTTYYLDPANTTLSLNIAGGITSAAGISSFALTQNFSWNAKSADTVYQAASDGFVTAYNELTGGQVQYIEGFTDASNPPTTTRVITYINSGAVIPYGSIMFPVKKGDYWKVKKQNVSGSPADPTIFWVPLGTAG